MDKTKKKSVKRYIPWAFAAIVVAWLAVMPLMARQQQAEEGPRASILNAVAVNDSLRTDIHGGGTLEAGDPEEIEIPKDVKIRKFLVKNGDLVQEGDPLAEVDKVSVLTAITEVEKSMSTVKSQMEKVNDEKADGSVTAVAGGRVKQVFAQKGDRVETVMLEHGALAILSLDEKMCVKLSVASDLSGGATVKVTLENGKEVTGRVESNLEGEVLVTVEDKGYEVGQTVTVENLGTGKLEIHSPWAATAFTGTVSTVYATPERVLSSGATLFTLKDTDYTAQREILAGTHREYEELLQKLFQMYESGCITAPCDGMVFGIDKDSAHLLSGEEEEIIAQPLTSEEDCFRLVLLSDVVPLEEEAACTMSSACPLPDGDPGHNPRCPHACNESESCKAVCHKATCVSLCISADELGKCPAIHHKRNCIEACTKSPTEEGCTAEKHQLGCIRSCDVSDGSTECPALIHKETCIKKCIHADTVGICGAKLHHYVDCIESCSGKQEPEIICPASKHKKTCYYLGASYTAKVFKVSVVGNLALVGFWDPNIYPVEKTGSGWVRSDGKPFDTTLLTRKGTIENVSNANSFQEGDILLFLTATKNGESNSLGPVLQSRTAAQSATIPAMGGFTIPSMGGGASASTQTQLYSLTGDVLMTVTPQDTMRLTLSVDESDILDIKTGMPVEVTVGALPGEVFEGEITKVSMSGSGNGGSSKFAVEVTLPRESEMLAGMSASAVITLYEKMNVLTIPAAALMEDGAKTVVYTALDNKTGQPTSPVEVTTGLSDGERVEILSGLKSGDTIYYAYYDMVEESDAVELDRFKMS